MYESEIEYTYENPDGDEVTVTIIYGYEPGSAERRYGHPDDWHAAEGPEIDLMKAIYENGKEMSKKEFTAFLCDHQESVENAITDEQEEN